VKVMKVIGYGVRSPNDGSPNIVLPNDVLAKTT
jgi:hypothetical protein